MFNDNFMRKLMLKWCIVGNWCQSEILSDVDLSSPLRSLHNVVLKHFSTLASEYYFFSCVCVSLQFARSLLVLSLTNIPIYVVILLSCALQAT